MTLHNLSLYLHNRARNRYKFLLYSNIYLQLMNHTLVGGIGPQLDQVHHHQVGVEARVALARRPPQLGARRLDVVGPEGAHVLERLLLHHADGLVLVHVQELVVQLPHIVVEDDVSRI